MRILQLGPYPPPEGGINRNMLAIREELCARGHECLIVAAARSSKVVPEPEVYHPQTPLALIGWLIRLRYDLLHLHIGGEISARVMALIAVCAFFGRGGRSVLSFHSGGYPLSKKGRSAKKKSIRGFIFRRYKRIIAVNPLIAEVFERYGVERERIRIIYPFVHKKPDENVTIPATLKNFAKRHKPFLLTVGLLEDDYDLFLQIDAMKSVLEKFPDAGLMIVGSGSLEEELKKAIAAKSYGEKIFLAGDVEHKITLHLINDCDILLRTTKFDGDAISVREALYLDTPVIASDNGMRPEGVDLIPTGDIDALVKAIETVARRERSVKTVKADDRSNIAAVLNVYDELRSEQ